VRIYISFIINFFSVGFLLLFPFLRLFFLGGGGSVLTGLSAVAAGRSRGFLRADWALPPSLPVLELLDDCYRGDVSPRGAWGLMRPLPPWFGEGGLVPHGWGPRLRCGLCFWGLWGVRDAPPGQRSPQQTFCCVLVEVLEDENLVCTVKRE